MSEGFEEDWRALDTDTLTAQYSARAAVPEHPAIFARWRAASEATRRAATDADLARLDLAYGDDEAERIDLFLPARPRARPMPLHVFLHGGYWQAMHRRDFSFVADGLNAAGEAVAVMGYPLCPGVAFEDLLASVEAGWQWLADARSDFGLATTGTAIAGHSAGGHMAAWLALAAARGERPAPARVVAVSGVFELEPLVHTPLNDALQLDEARARANSPGIGRPVHGKPAPLSCWVGGLESAEFHRQSHMEVERWRAAGSRASLATVPGANHFTVLDQMYAPDGPLVAGEEGALP